LTPERRAELRHRIDQRFDQFSLHELRDVESGRITFKSSFPELTLRERQFAEEHFNRKMDKLRGNGTVARVDPSPFKMAT